MGLYKGLDEGGHPVVRYFGAAEDAHARAQGFVPASDDEAAQATGGIDDRTGGALGAIGAGVSSTLAGATLGLSDLALRGLLSESEMARLAADRADHPILSGAGELAGTIAPAVLSGGASLPAGLVSGSGAAIAERAGGGVLGAALGGAVEGAFYGYGQGTSELALSSDPLTLEHAAAVLPSSVLYGAATGGVIGAGGHLIGAGLARAKGALDDFVAARDAAKALRDDPAAIGSADVGALDAKGLNKAHAAELGRIEAERAPVRQQFAADLDDFARDMRDQQLSRAARGAEDRDAREAGKVLYNADRSLRGLTDDPVGLAQRPERALAALRTQENALGKLQAWGEEETSRVLEERAAAPAQIRANIEAGKVPGYVPGALSPRGIDLAVEREMAAKYGTDAALPKNLQLLNAVPAALERNRALQTRLVDLVADPASARLTEIAQAREALGAPQPKSLGSLALHAAAKFAGPVGALAEHGAGVIAGLRKAAGAAAERGAKAVSAFLGPASRAVERAAIVTPVATRALASVRYSEPPRDDRGKLIDKPEPKTLPELYKARTDEIKSQVQLAPDGSFQMRPQARLKMAARLSGLGATDPIAADRLESAGAMRITWLASQIPKRPDLAGLPVGPDTWNPSDMVMRSFARKVAAVEDPYAVLARASAGKEARVVPEEVMALQAVHQPLLNDYITQVITGLSDRKERLPYAQRLAFSMLTGQPIDPAMTPVVLRELQSMHASEPGTAGGTMAPRPSPQFGSVKRVDTGTPAQRRQGVGL